MLVAVIIIALLAILVATDNPNEPTGDQDSAGAIAPVDTATKPRARWSFRLRNRSQPTSTASPTRRS